MTYQYFETLMDNFLPRKEKYSNNINADDKLDSTDRDILHKFVEDFDTQKENFKWKTRLKDVATVANKYHSGTMPFLINQVLFYTATVCNLLSLASHEKIRVVLSGYDLTLSHNFFSRLRVTDRVNAVDYIQPDPLFPYPGQKKEEFGVAIKNLVYQAGAYNLFIDLFGGSGAASVAFPKRNNSVYLYNDLDKDLCNIFKVISDDQGYQDLIEYMICLQDDLRGEHYEFNPLCLDFKKETQDFYARRTKQGKRSGKTGNEKRVNRDLVSALEHPVDENVADIVDFMKFFHDRLEEFEIYDEEKKIFFDDWGGVVDNDSGMFGSYVINFQKIAKFIASTPDLSNLNMDIVSYDNAVTGVESVTMFEFMKRANHLRFYKHYAVFSNVLDDQPRYKAVADNIRKTISAMVATYKNKHPNQPIPDMTINYEAYLAAAKIFLMWFITNGQPDISSVLRIYNTNKSGKSSTEWEKFLGAKFDVIIDDMHERLRKNDKALANREHKSTKGANRTLTTRFIIEEMDCIALLDKYKGRKHTLVYSDSPYIATTGYEAGDFTKDNMKALLDKLLELDCKFIFSCRACAYVKKSTYDVNELHEKNQSIWDDVFGQIETTFKDKQLCVLTIGKKGKSFWDIVKNNGIAEIMITNYDIYGFTDMDYPNVTYESCTFADFKKSLKQYINEVI